MLLPTDRDRLRVVLVSTRNPLNIGAAARAMSNFGFGRLRVVNPYEVAFRDARSAVGAADLLASAEACPSIADAVKDCSVVVGTTAVGQRELHHTLLRLEAGALIIKTKLTSDAGETQLHRTDNVALLFGSEKRGLSNEDLSHCDWLIQIPTRAEHLSMNLGQAVAICLYELIREDGATRHGGAIVAAGSLQQSSSGEMERVATVLLDALLTSGYTDEQRKLLTEQLVRRLVRRMNLASGDAELLLGMLRQVLWKMRTGDHRRND